MVLSPVSILFIFFSVLVGAAFAATLLVVGAIVAGAVEDDGHVTVDLPDAVLAPAVGAVLDGLVVVALAEVEALATAVAPV